MPRALLFLRPSPASMLKVPGSRMEPHVFGVWAWISTQLRLAFRSRSGPTAILDEVAQATLQLRRELLDLDVEAVEMPRAGEPPPQSKAVDVAALGALVVNLADSQLLAAVVAAT